MSYASAISVDDQVAFGAAMSRTMHGEPRHTWRMEADYRRAERRWQVA